MFENQINLSVLLKSVNTSVLIGNVKEYLNFVIKYFTVKE